jgi:hypothetical protein
MGGENALDLFGELAIVGDGGILASSIAAVFGNLVELGNLFAFKARTG